MPIRPRGSTWQADVASGSRRFRKSFRTRQEAEAWEATAKARLLNGQAVDTDAPGMGGSHTLKSLAEIVHDRVWAQNRDGDGTRGKALSAVAVLGEDLDPAVLTRPMIESAVEKWKAQNHTGSTINRKLSALNVMLKYAEQNGWIRSKPSMPWQREGAHRVRFFSPDEEKRVLEWFQFTGRLDMVDFTSTLIDTGMRCSEALAFSMRNVEDGIIRVWGSKTERERCVPMTERVATIVDRRKMGRPPDMPLFAPMSYRAAEHAWRTCRAALGFKDDEQWVMHVCRHTFCSRLIQRGVDLLTVMQLAGHTCLRTTQRYAHLAPANLSEAIAKLNQAPVVLKFPGAGAA